MNRQDAALQADILVVAVNDDHSVKALKGESRPVFPMPERLEIVAALAVVDFAFAFSELDVRSIISVLKPDVHAKGTDYTEETVPERDEVVAYGGRVAICGDAKEHSTSDILAKLKRD